MRVGFAAWNGRIAPVFDVSRRLHVIETAGPLVVSETDETLDDGASGGRMARLAALGIQTLVCGAISRQQAALIEAHGLKVVAFVAGELREVIDAWRTGRLRRPAFAMPGSGSARDVARDTDPAREGAAAAVVATGRRRTRRSRGGD